MESYSRQLNAVIPSGGYVEGDEFVPHLVPILVPILVAILVAIHRRDFCSSPVFFLGERQITMRTSLPLKSAAAPVLFVLVAACSFANAQTGSALCHPTVTANQTVATPQQRYLAGLKAEPPLTDHADGFAWPDTPIGVIKTDDGYEFFGSDGGLHSRQLWQGQWHGNGKYGSATRALGTLDNALGSAPPIDVSIQPNPDPSVNPFYSSYDYMGGGPVYKVPQGMIGAGNLLMVYHAEIPTVTTQSFYSVLALAASSDNGLSWTDLGEIIRINQAYRTDLDGFDIGDAPLAISPDGKYFYIYFRDWLANGTVHPTTVTLASVARAPVTAVLADAFGSKPHAASFQKYYNGSWALQQGLGGLSTDLNPTAPYTGELQVAYDSFLQRYVMIIGEGVLIAYTESADGIRWEKPIVIYEFQGQPNTYVMPVGAGDDPRILGQQFYIFYTFYPSNGEGWDGAAVGRLTVACQ
jgi:hypothetical protein